MCSLVVNGVAARPGPRHDGLPAAHAPLQGRRHDHDRAVARARPSRSSRIWSSTAARSTASSPPAATSRSTSAARRTATRSRSRRTSPRRRWTRPPASAAAPASPRARTRRRTCSSSAKISHLALLPQGQPERHRRASRDGRADGRRRVRQLLERGRVRGGLPEGDSDLQHRAMTREYRARAAQPQVGAWRPS